MPFAVLGLVVVIRVLAEYLVGGWGAINYVGNVLFVVGWGLGHLLADLDHLFYAYACNPQELSCLRVKNEIANKRWRSAWAMLQATSGERKQLPVHNVLTGLIVAMLGIWTVTSSGSLIASGAVLGLGVRLILDFWQTDDYHKWYWIFAREFSPRENTIVRWVWAALLLVAVIGLIR